MKPPLTPPRAVRARRQSPWLVWSLIVLCAGIPAAALYTVAECFRLGPDARALSRGFRDGRGLGLELRLGALPLSLLRFGLHRAPLEPEARMALDALRGVEVGVYPFAGGSDSEAVSKRIAAGSEALSARGWHRVVGVANDDVTVSVHAHDDERRPDRIQLCAAVQHESHLVVVSIRGDVPDTLLEAIGSRLPVSPGHGRKHRSNREPKSWGSHSMVSHR